MAGRKDVRTRGKLQLSRYFQKLKAGDSVAVLREVSLVTNFPKRIQGRTGTIVGKRGKAYVIKMKDNAKEKEYIIEAIHLKKIKQIKK